MQESPENKRDNDSSRQLAEEMLEKALRQLQQFQNNDGSFSCYQKIIIGAGNEQWTESFPVPFITASVLCSLINIRHKLADEIARKGRGFLMPLQEYGGLWRYWKHSPYVDCVPPDADDTCLSSFFIKAHTGIAPENLHWLTENQNEAGMLLTWFTPQPRFKKYPALYAELLHDAPNYKATIEKGYLHPDDWEVSVMANILLYLGENQATFSSINYIVDCLSGDKPFEKQYYKNDTIIWYHVARAFENGVHSFRQLKEAAYRNLHHKVQADFHGDNLLESILAAITLTYFNAPVSDTPFLRWLLSSTPPVELHSLFPYYTSKDSLFYASAPSLGWSWYAELLQLQLNGR